jgi:HD-GYP domain-containing protein (c-di-GMP phosphodiesterase class II)
MTRNINKLLLRRLSALWLLASLVAGGVVFYIEMEKVDEQVLHMGTSGAYAIDQSVIEQIPEIGPSALAALEALAARLIEGEFVIVEIYSKDKKHLATAVRHDSKRIDRILGDKQHQFPLDQDTHYEKFYIDQSLYIQVLVPLRSQQGRVHGYFEGVYRVDEATLEEIQSRVYHSLILVLSVILATFVMLYPVILYLNRQLIRFSGELFRANIELLEVMGSAIAKRDSITDSHNYRVTLYAMRLGEALKLDDETMSQLIAGAFLHDVGKIGIEDGILRKPGGLSETEFSRMREHVIIGIDIIAKANWLHGAREVIEFHHEKFDGSGYMRGLQGEAIPLVARIFAIVDVFDALTSERPYKAALPLDEVLTMMLQERGRHFDPRILDLFIALAPSLYKGIGKASYPSLTRMLSVVVQNYFFNARLK